MEFVKIISREEEELCHDGKDLFCGAMYM